MVSPLCQFVYWHSASNFFCAKWSIASNEPDPLGLLQHNSFNWSSVSLLWRRNSSHASSQQVSISASLLRQLILKPPVIWDPILGKIFLMWSSHFWTPHQVRFLHPIFQVDRMSMLGRTLRWWFEDLLLIKWFCSYTQYSKKRGGVNPLCANLIIV